MNATHTICFVLVELQNQACLENQPGCARQQGSKVGPGAKVSPSPLLVHNNNHSSCPTVALADDVGNYTRRRNVFSLTRFLVQNMLMVEHCIGRSHHLGCYLCCLYVLLLIW